MSEEGSPGGWFAVPAPGPREKPARSITASAAAEVPPQPWRSSPQPARAVAAPSKPVRKYTAIDLGILAIAGLIIVSGLLEVLEAARIVSSGLGAQASPLLGVVGGMQLLLGVGLLARNELARRVYLVLAFIGLAGILLGSGSSSTGAVVVNLIVQLIPIVFLMRGSIAAKFA
jgi:hypothetical protein